MIGTDEPNALVIVKNHMVVGACYLGYAILESGEMLQLEDYAQSRGYSLRLVPAEECKSMSDMISGIKAVID